MHLLILVFGILASKAPEETDEKKKVTTIIELEPQLKLREKKRNRIVQTEQNSPSAKPKEDAFLGKSNQVVKKETVGKQLMPETPGSPRSTPKVTPTKPSKGLARLRSLGVPLFQNQRKNPDQPRWESPGFQQQDYVRGVEESALTALNTREYVYFGYFQRIRDQLNQAWVPLLREKLLKYQYAGRKLASDRDHVTRLLVTLNEYGEVIRVQMISDSGVSDLDDAARAAFNKAGPFPHPPKGIIDANHEIKIPWDFILKT